MITIQHTLCMLIDADGDIDKFKKKIAYALLPDAIRMYTKYRQYSHFEQGLNKDVSWIKFPMNIKNISPTILNDSECHLVPSECIPTCVIGEPTIFDKFKETNKHLPDIYYDGIAKHLIQDIIFDDFVRTVFDCSKMYEDKFKVNNKYYNGKEFRNIIGKTEQQLFYFMSWFIRDEYGIIVDQNWFDENIYPVLKLMYPEEMADNTYKYMRIDPQTNEWIRTDDRSHTEDFIVSMSNAYKLLSDVIIKMKTYKSNKIYKH